MCTTELLKRVEKEHNELDKKALNELLAAQIKIHELTKALTRANVKNAQLAIQVL
jgi:hypothetical protein